MAADRLIVWVAGVPSMVNVSDASIAWSVVSVIPEMSPPWSQPLTALSGYWVNMIWEGSAVALLGPRK